MPEPPPGLPPARIEYVPGRGEYFIRDAGAGTPIVLLHGFLVPADVTWFTCYPALAEIGRVIGVDHRGHGRGLRASKPFRLTDVADDIAALIEHLGTGPVIAVGYSMGGAIAQLLWQRHPEVVRGLVLCATSASFNQRTQHASIRLLHQRGMGVLQVLLRLLPRHWVERVLLAQVTGRLPFRLTRLITADTPIEALVELMPWIVAELDRASAEDVAEAGRDLARFDSGDWIGAVDVPTGVIVCTDDELVSVVAQRDLVARLPGPNVYELGLNHDAVLARPEVFVPTLVKAVIDLLAADPHEAASDESAPAD